jgi:hypothetical protein
VTELLWLLAGIIGYDIVFPRQPDAVATGTANPPRPAGAADKPAPRDGGPPPQGAMPLVNSGSANQYPYRYGVGYGNRGGKDYSPVGLPMVGLEADAAGGYVIGRGYQTGTNDQMPGYYTPAGRPGETPPIINKDVQSSAAVYDHAPPRDAFGVA